MEPVLKSFFCSVFLLVAAITSSAADSRETVPNGGSCSISMRDGTVFNGTLDTGVLGFKGTFGELTVNTQEIVDFKENTLTLTDKTILKGGFTTGALKFKTTRGTLDLPLVEVVGIATQNATVKTPSQSTGSTTISLSGSTLTGSVFDNFGTPLAGAEVLIENTQFRSTTASDGAYSIGYVPGHITVHYRKDGYYDNSLVLDIAVNAAYPVQKQILHKIPPGVGVFVIQNAAYLTLQKQHIFINTVDLNNNSFDPTKPRQEMRYYAKGAPTIITPNGKLSFAQNDKNALQLFKVSSDGTLCKQLTYGFSGGPTSKPSASAIGKALAPEGDMFYREYNLESGYYAFVAPNNDPGYLATGIDTRVGRGNHPIQEPCYFFAVDPSQQSNPAIGGQANASGTAQSFGNPQFEKIVANDSDAKFFKENAISVDRDYDTTWEAVVDIMKTGKEIILKSDKESGVILTDRTTHGVFNVTYPKYFILIERLGATKCRITSKVARWEGFLTKGTEEVWVRIPVGPVTRHQDELFRKTILKKLGIKESDKAWREEIVDSDPAASANASVPRVGATEAQAQCIKNLKLIDAAVQMWALEKRKSSTDRPVIEKDMLQYLRGSIMPVCPAGGIYRLGETISSKPKCNIPGHDL